MRWLAKAALQRTLGVLPQGERLNYVFQRHVLRSFPVPDKSTRQKFTRALAHIAAYEEFGPGVPREEATFYEFGAGWDLAIPIAYADMLWAASPKFEWMSLPGQVTVGYLNNVDTMYLAK